MRFRPTQTALLVLLLIAGCDDDSSVSTSTSTTGPIGSSTTTPVTTTTLADTTTTVPHPDLSTVETALIAQIPSEWTRPTVTRAPFSITVCGRSIRVVDADPTDESPGRPREGISVSSTAPNGETVNLVVYEQYMETAWSGIEEALPVCGSTTQTNPVDGWTLSTAVEADYDTISGLIGIRVSSDSDRVYTGNRATRYSASRLLLSVTNGLLVRVTISHASTDLSDLVGVDDLLLQGAEILRLATAG